ncbi:potassium channel family protein [Aquipuribacter sp. SD81]|uniref:potassium channel family protein n=1 Tax=Aquipuribacter sp. SD81 TaxID=3127703 RepID=UPI00301A5E26
MRVVIAGAGSVGRSIARELISHGHQVLLIDRLSKADRMKDTLEQAEFLYADACEIQTLDEARIDTCDVLVAATGDDKANLVVSLLAKTEYGVSRVVARVNNPRNEWLFDGGWGVDVAVSTPRLMTALVEEAVEVGEMVRLFQLQQSAASLFEFTVPASSPVAGTPLRRVELPADTVITCIVRDHRPLAPSPDDTVEAGDELMILTTPEQEEDLADLLATWRHSAAG